MDLIASDITLSELQKLAKESKSYVFATYLVAPDGRVATYTRLIDPTLLVELWDTPEHDAKKLRDFFSEDMWWTYARLYNAPKDSRETEASS